MSIIPADILQLQKDMLAIIHWFHSRGWSPATSTNYSFRNPGTETYTISRSGVDKSDFGPEDFMVVDRLGRPTEEYSHLKPSAETLIHTTLYQDKGINVILHTHSVPATVLSLRCRQEGKLKLEGFELLKGLRGITTHETELTLPVFGNSQDMPALSAEIGASAADISHGFLLAGHGLYTWGADIPEAKRHVEVFEFLFECMIHL